MEFDNDFDNELTTDVMMELENERREIEMDERAAAFLDSLDGYPEEER